jgi:hypothetical protein
MENEITEQEKQEQQELHKAIGMRATLGQRHGWAYAIKWFAEWQKEHNKKQ